MHRLEILPVITTSRVSIHEWTSMGNLNMEYSSQVSKQQEYYMYLSINHAKNLQIYHHTNLSGGLTDCWP